MKRKRDQGQVGGEGKGNGGAGEGRGKLEGGMVGEEAEEGQGYGRRRRGRVRRGWWVETRWRVRWRGRGGGKCEEVVKSMWRWSGSERGRGSVWTKNRFH